MTLKDKMLPFLTTFTQLAERLKNFFRGWLLILGLKEGLVECATVCVKSEVILINIVDLCASYDTHLPEKLQFTSTIGVGIVEEELLANKRLSQYYVQDLNENPNLQFIDDESVDVVLCTLSVDLLIKVCLCSIRWIGEIVNTNTKY